MKICCVGYRDWALKIYDFLSKNSKNEFYIIKSKNEYCEKNIREYNPDYILFYGWSWIIDKDLINDYKCVMLHPSPLPKYRGGSPIQNQIINGEMHSAVTLFIMDDGIDTGDIIAQDYLSLEGHLDEIFDRIYKIGSELTMNIFENGYDRKKQDNSQSTYFPRRKKEESEITLEELKNMNGDYLYNKIRMLEDPYPNSFIRTADGKKILIKLAEME